MLQGVNLEEVKSYNASLKQYRDRAATLNAEIDYTNKELDALCAELSAELGKPVTRDNIEQIYQEQLESINSTLHSGKTVLAKIASEENAGVSASQSMGVAQTVPSMTSPVVPPVAPPVQGGVFNGQAATLPGQGSVGALPPMFNL